MLLYIPAILYMVAQNSKHHSLWSIDKQYFLGLLTVGLMIFTYISYKDYKTKQTLQSIGVVNATELPIWGIGFLMMDAMIAKQAYLEQSYLHAFVGVVLLCISCCMFYLYTKHKNDVVEQQQEQE